MSSLEYIFNKTLERSVSKLPISTLNLGKLSQEAYSAQ